MHSRKAGIASRTFDFVIFACCMLVILFVATYRKVFLLAPPYDVTAYLVLFEKHSKFSIPTSVALSYLVVVLSTTVLHFVLGDTAVSLALNIIVVAAFISYTKFSHPPAIALTVFSYLTDDIVGFVVTSIIVLGIIFTFSALTSSVFEHG